MSFDGFVTRAVARELSARLTGGRINQIHQPERDEIVLSIRTPEKNLRLLVSANASSARVHLTEEKKENPMTAPLFCMILRKHLCGGKILSVLQEGFDRVIKIAVESYTELGDLTVKTLVVEIMSRHSNVILIDADNKIIDSIKHVDLTVSAVRQVLPGFFYELPPRQDKLNPAECGISEIEAALKATPSDIAADKALVGIFLGMSPLLSREILHGFCGEVGKMLCELDLTAYAFFIYEFFLKIRRGEGEASVVFESDKKPVCFSCVRLLQYGEENLRTYGGISEAIDSYYSERGIREHIIERSAHIVKIINNNIERCKKKIAIHNENIKKAQNRDRYKLFGDLITANIYRLLGGEKKIEVENYYSEQSEMLEIPLKEELSPSQNAQRYYKLYSKAKTAEEISRKQIGEAEEELYYLETVLDSVTKAEAASDIAEIKEELSDGGYISRVKKKVKSNKKSSPMEFLSSDGFKILVGRNNRQNDELTIKTAYSTDIWLHTKIIPGSHTIIRTNGGEDVPKTTLLEAACLAAYFSKAKNSSQVPVDFTAVKNVKKPSGAKPGLVIYDNYSTAYVSPSEELVKKLKVE